ncbi:MAG TPA: PAS domain S-box protein [Gallionella sp.]|nr:PAS domain S-box protein [Gallionella sp.]
MKNNDGIGKTIRPIFSPAIALLNRMGYTRKFTLLWLMSLVAIAVVTYSLFASLDRVIQPSQRELQGLVLIEPASRTVQLIQLHRGLSAALLGGNETMRDRRAAQEREAAEAFKAMEGKLPPRLVSSEGFLRIKTDWERLRKEGLLWTAEENFAAHTRLIEQLQSFEELIADDYALILDAELDTYYLIDTNVNKLPHVLEHLGQLRAYGTGILARKQINEPQKAKLNALSAELDSTLRELRINIEKTGRYNPAVQKSLLAAYGGIANSAQQISGLVASDILAGHFATPQGVFLDMATAEIDNSYTQMHQVLLPTTKTLIEARIARAKNTLLVTVSSAVLLLLLVVYLSISIYYAIIGSIRSLVRSAHTFAEGDLSVRVKLNTRDELSHIGDSFNKMAEGFNALLDERTQAVHALYESEKLYHSLFENMLNGFAYCQMLFEQGQPQDFVYLNVNAAFEAQTGLKNVVGKKVSEVIPGIRQSDPELFEVYGRVALSGKPERLEIYLTAMQQWFGLSVYSPKEGYFVAVFDVITERKQAEDALRKSKDLLQSVIENAPVQIFWKDRDSRYLGCNTNFAKGAGYSAPDEVAGKTDFEMAWKDHAESYRADDKAVMGSGIPKLNFEEPFTTPDGNLAWAHTSKVPLRDESNQVIGILGIYEDITERKRAEIALRETEERFSLAFHSSPAMIALATLDGKHVDVNKAYADFLGYPREKILGKSVVELHVISEEERQKMLELARKGGGSVHNADIEVQLRDGRLCHLLFSLETISIGGVQHSLATLLDITERKRAEGALRKSKDLLQSVVENTPVHIFWKDRDSRYLGCNTQFAKAAGYSRPDELIGKTDFDIWQKDLSELYRADDNVVMDSGNAKLDYEEPGATPDGNMIWARTSKVPLRDESNRIIGVLGVYEDITERKRTEQELIKSRQQAQHYLDIAGVMLVALDRQGRVQMINQKGCEMLGYSEADILGKNWFDNYLPSPERKRVGEIFAQLMGGDIVSTEYHENRILTKSGDVLTVAWHNSIMLDDSGEISGALSSGEDITERKQAEQELLEGRKRLHAIIETALDAVVQMDDEGIITGWNAQAEKIFGWSRDEAVGRMMSETIVPQQYREAHKQGLKRFLTTGEGAILNSQVEMLGMHRDGHEFPIELAVVPIKAGDQYEFSGFIRDITERKKAEDMIWRQANFDTLTGLPNRHMFYDRLAQEIKKAERTGLPMALLYIDLDRFKEINDTLGHSMGDILLVETARRISACVREADTVGRLGGDEFIIILTDLQETGRIDALSQNILRKLAEPFRLESEVAYLSASLGITLYPHDAAGMEELIKNADQAMYAAKNAGRNRFNYFTQSMQQTAQARMRLVNDLRGALAAGQLRLYFQPIVELATGRIHKTEALIRWQHPLRGMVSPAEFIPLAEETGLILEIGDWVFREAVREAKRWRASYDPEFQVSVNMSPVQFHGESSPCRQWPAHLREAGLPGQSLVIEITEGVLLEKEPVVMDKLLRFRDANIQISLDDFGTGYSSLSYLQKFDIDYLKIDQSFTCKLEAGSSSMALSEAIIVMAHRLGMKVIAEGVETEAQRTLLAVAGCDYGQGYLFSRPVPAEEFEELLKGGLTRGSQAE